MEKHKCDESVYGRKCNESFDTESQYKKHFSNSHKVTKENPLETKNEYGKYLSDNGLKNILDWGQG